MKNKNSCKSGFTLIELLVVVLIIGILASIAWPQYQKAVEKSKSAQALVLLKSVVQAQEAYYMANGNYAGKFDELTVEIPWTGNTQWRSGTAARDTLSNDEWSIQLFRSTSSNSVGVYVGRISGNYKGGGFVYYLVNDYTNVPEKQILCAERNSNGVIFEGSRGDYCKKIFQGVYRSSVGVAFFTLP